VKILYLNGQRGMALGIALLMLIVLSVLSIFAIQLHQKSFRESTASTHQTQLRLHAYANFERLRDVLTKDIQSKLSVGNTSQIDFIPIEFGNAHYQIKCLGEGNPFKANQCSYEINEFPKLVSLRIETRNSDAEVLRISATLSFQQAALSNMSYLILNETKSSVNFGRADIGGAVGIFFAGPGEINFYDNANFEELFFTNLSADQLKFPINSAKVDFKKGILTNGNGFSGMILDNFNQLVSTAEIPGKSSGPMDTPPDYNETGASELRVKLGNVSGKFGASFVKTTYFQVCTSGVCQVQSQSQNFPHRQIPNNQVYFFPGKVIVDSISDKEPAILGQSNFTMIAQDNIELASSIVRDESLKSNEGNIALVSLQGSEGLIINKNSRSLIPHSSGRLLKLEELPEQNIAPDQIAFNIEASAVALNPTASPLHFSSDLFHLQADAYQIGKCKSFGSLIGPTYSPARILSNSNGRVLAGFGSTEFTFNRGALEDSAPGMSRPSSNLITTSLESFSEEDLTNLEKALADLD